jgi:Flp pilus assembly protein CpaB
MQLARKVLSTRQGTLVFAGISAVLALATLLIFVQGYKRNLDQGAQPVTVLVSAGPLPKGTSGDTIARRGLFHATGFKRDEVKDGAITDTGMLRGLVATHAIVPGQQLTLSDFAKPSDPVISRLAEDQRAVSVPLDSAHGLIGQVEAGDHVDVLAGFEVESDTAARPHPMLRVLLQDVEVLQAPAADAKSGGLASGGSNATQDVVLRVTDQQAAQLAFSSDNGKVWITLRPQTGARQGQLSLVTLERLLFGLKPIPLGRHSAIAKAAGESF